jgi:small subunit ribosomal protein S3Ae
MAKRTPKKAGKRKGKQWYKILAPPLFNEAELGETLTSDPTQLIGRVAEATLQEITGDAARTHVKLYFQIYNVEELTAKTNLVGHELTSDYVRRLVRRRRSKMDMACNVTTKDGYTIRVKPMIVTNEWIQTTQKTLMRNTALDIVRAEGEHDFDTAMQRIVFGPLAADISTACNRIRPVKRVEIRRSEVSKE